MKTAQSVAPLAALLLLSTPAVAADAPASRAASIPFANHNGVRDWVAIDDQTIYFQGNGRRWFKATLFRPSADLQFVEAIGLATGPTGALDKWSSVVVRGERIPLGSFEQVDGPPVRRDKADQP